MPNQRDGNDSLSQLDKFKEAARELECDDNETRFKDRLGKLVRANHPKEKQI